MTLQLLLQIIGTVVGFGGSFLVAQKSAKLRRLGFASWLVSNTALIMWCYLMGAWVLIWMNIFYLGAAAFGYWNNRQVIKISPWLPMPTLINQHKIPKKLEVMLWLKDGMPLEVPGRIHTTDDSVIIEFYDTDKFRYYECDRTSMSVTHYRHRTDGPESA